MAYESARVRIPRDVQNLPFINAGLSGWVYALDEFMVIKVACGTREDSLLDHAVERKILERLGEHPRIVKLLGACSNALVLERLLYPLRVRTLELREIDAVPPTEDILKWSAQAAEGMHYFHGKNVMQVDVGLHNMLLNWDENIKYCDFAGSSIDGSRPHVFPGTRSENPRVPFDSPNVQSDLFALASALYEISTARKVYEDRQEGEIAELLQNGEYPEVDHLVLGHVMLKCWSGEYLNAGEAAAEIRHIQRRIKLNDLSQSVPELIRQHREQNRRRGEYLLTPGKSVCLSH